jgi:hypothetical protein
LIATQIERFTTTGMQKLAAVLARLVAGAGADAV